MEMEMVVCFSVALKCRFLAILPSTMFKSRSKNVTFFFTVLMGKTKIRMDFIKIIGKLF